MNKKIISTILGNLIMGNLIIYLHEIYGRQQAEVSPRLWISFSLVAVVALICISKLLETRKSILSAFALSLVGSFLIPVVGFFSAMEFSLVAAFVGAAYLFYGFFMLVFPMFVLNFSFFRWIQRG